MKIDHRVLRDFYFRIIQAVGTPAEEAGMVADGLIDADLHGIDSHGAVRIPSYIRTARDGRIRAASRPTVEWQRNSTALIDGHHGWGQPAAMLAVGELTQRARQYGTGAVSIKNTNHIGTLAYYGRALSAQGLLAFVTTNAAPNMAPWGGRGAVLGTNPICFSAPGPEGRAIVVDMANSIVAHGKIMLAKEKGEAIPANWALDKAGKSTTDPVAALEGSILPVGGPKGYGLALFADILSGVMSGANSGTKVNSIVKPGTKPAGVGAFFFAIDLSPFGREGFDERLAALVSMVTGVELAEGVDRIYLPGEIEWEKAQDRRKNGIPISEAVLQNLQSIGNEMNVGMPQAIP